MYPMFLDFSHLHDVHLFLQMDVLQVVIVGEGWVIWLWRFEGSTSKFCILIFFTKRYTIQVNIYKIYLNRVLIFYNANSIHVNY